ncbi:MAG TPA: putative peptidoglycan glycosyltransferase FtsW [Verrucomicrobiae bacterium]|nr:putative peptidoglycan glycosyltransferase FtsW [Verrucomicrobiae bacterium]
MKLTATLFAFCVAALLALGLVMLYSASSVQVGTTFLLSQLMWGGVGLVACAVMMSLDYRDFKKGAWGLFGIATILLILVLLIAAKRNGARRWLTLAGQSFQPSELAKLALVVCVAWYGDTCRRHMHTFWRGLAIPGIFIGPTLGLIVLEPDFGTTILLASVSLIMLVLAGARLRWIVPPALVAAVILGAVVWHNENRRERIMNWWYLREALAVDTKTLPPDVVQRLEESKRGVNHQAWEAMLAFGSGGPKGLGLGNGRQKHGFIPEHQTDFIFSVIGEELGLVATLGVVAVFMVLVVCGLVIGWNAPDIFGFLLASGLTCLIGLQAFINLAVVTSLVPNKGLPLPFISKGGSSLMIMLACAGVILSVARQAGRQTVTEPALMGEERPLAPQDNIT